MEGRRKEGLCQSLYWDFPEDLARGSSLGLAGLNNCRGGAEWLKDSS